MSMFTAQKLHSLKRTEMEKKIEEKKPNTFYSRAFSVGWHSRD